MWGVKTLLQLSQTEHYHHAQLVSSAIDPQVFREPAPGLYLWGAYNLVQIREGDKWKMAFRTYYGHFEYTVMSFGLTSGTGVFMHFMNDVWQDILGHFMTIYLVAS